jgi:hypothetical protein
MKVKEAIKYLIDADPDLDVVVMDRKTYDRLINKAKTLNAIANKWQGNEIKCKIIKQ